MITLEILHKSFIHLTNEMLDNDINWWLERDGRHWSLALKRDIVLPRLIEEKLKRNELYF